MAYFPENLCVTFGGARPEAGVLLVTPHLTPAVGEIVSALGDEVDVYCSDAESVWGSRRSASARLRFYWLDPTLTMMRLAHRIWRYGLIVNYQHRNGYWLGLITRFRPRTKRPTLVWVGFAPNPRSPTIAGGLRERITAATLAGYELLVCHARPATAASKARFPALADRFEYVRWAGAADIEPVSDDGGYVFAGGRTNRDFATVLQATTRLGTSTTLVTSANVDLGDVPSHVQVRQDVPAPVFEQLLVRARVVVVALMHPEVSSGQVVLNLAMRNGKAVLASRTAGIDDYVNDGRDALLFTPGDVDDLAAKLEYLLANPQRRRELGQEARRTYESTFNARVFAQELVARVREVEPGRTRSAGTSGT